MTEYFLLQQGKDAAEHSGRQEVATMLNGSADFYIGRGLNAEWIGSLEGGGAPDELLNWVHSSEIFGATSEKAFRDKVSSMITHACIEDPSSAHNAGHGWPWPYSSSEATGWVYGFDQGAVWAWHWDELYWRRVPQDQPVGVLLGSSIEPDEGTAAFPRMRSTDDNGRPVPKDRVYGRNVAPTCRWSLSHLSVAILAELTALTNSRNAPDFARALRFEIDTDEDARHFDITVIAGASTANVLDMAEACDRVETCVLSFTWASASSPEDRRFTCTIEITSDDHSGSPVTVVRRGSRSSRT